MFQKLFMFSYAVVAATCYMCITVCLIKNGNVSQVHASSIFPAMFFPEASLLSIGKARCLSSGVGGVHSKCAVGVACCWCCMLVLCSLGPLHTWLRRFLITVLLFNVCNKP